MNFQSIIFNTIFMFTMVFVSCSSDNETIVPNASQEVSSTATVSVDELMNETSAIYHYKGKTYEGVIDFESAITTTDNLHQLFIESDVYVFDSENELDQFWNTYLHDNKTEVTTEARRTNVKVVFENRSTVTYSTSSTKNYNLGRNGSSGVRRVTVNNRKALIVLWKGKPKSFKELGRWTVNPRQTVSPRRRAQFMKVFPR